MRGLIILCITTLAIAAPQGYMYSTVGQGEAQPAEGASQELSEIHQNQKFSVELPNLQDLSPPLEQSQHYTPQVTILPSGEEHVAVPFATYGVLPPVPQPSQNEVVVSKQFYIHSAPEEEDDEVQEKILTVGQARKNYNVIFIRAPAKSQRTASIKLIPAVNEDKTIVYVLSKKAEAADISAHIEEMPTTTTKPEVYFIKYKTPEEASHAQEKIQAEYERLGGSTQVSNEGMSPISSVIGSLDGKAHQEEPTQVAPTSSAQLENVSAEELDSVPVNNGYLPPNYYY